MPERTRRPTLRMVAERAGVSTATVSYVFAGRSGSASGVSDATRRKVLAAAAQLDYRPNRTARATRTGRTGTVQLSLHMLSDPWSLAVAAAVNAEANLHGMTALILADGDWGTALDRVESDVVYLDGVDATPETADALRALAARGQHLVVFSETLEPDGFDVIRSDALPGCVLAMAHLLETHESIGCLTTASAVEAAGGRRTRYSAYLDGLASHGIRPQPDWTQTYELSPSSAFTAALRLLRAERRPTAIYTTTDFAGIAAINAAHSLGLRVPQDVAVVGVGGTPDAAFAQPSLTTVGPEDFYRTQARIIVDRARHPDAPPQRHDFPWSLIPGGSTVTTIHDEETQWT